ncbi:MAG TPA: AAA family ATPase [Acidimicrobiales bacterium]|nr:AAA family ATPase [Acidimicrobiales bacterium]
MSSGHDKTRDTLFVGRGSELGVLDRAVRSASEGRPTVVWIEGAAGSGKTTLVRHALAECPEPFVSTAVAGEELASAVPYDLSRRLGAEKNDDGFAVGQELLGLWAHRQEDGPVAVLIEDAHWADAESLQALLSATRRLERDRVVVLLTSRHPPNEGWERFVRDDERCQRLVLGPFQADDVAALASLYDRDLTSYEAARLTEHTAGHPLWVHTLLMELTEAELKAPGSLPAPQSLASAVTARLGTVTSPGRDLAAAMAVINQREPVTVVARVAGIEQPLEALDALLPTGFVRWDPRASGSPVEFSHPLYRQAVYDDLAPVRRRDLHRAAAQVLTPAAVLAHRVAATVGSDEDLADELERAAATEIAAGVPALAARDLLWASSVSGNADRSGRLVVEAGLAFVDSRQVYRAAALRDQIAAAPASPGRDVLLGRIAWDRGDARGAEEWFEMAAGDDAASDSIVAGALSKLAEIHLTRGEGREGLDAAERALAVAVGGTSAERNGWNMRALGIGLLHGAPAALDALRERLPADARQVPGREVEMLVIRGMLNYYAARTSEAIDDLRTAVRLADNGAGSNQLARCHYFMASSLTRRGDWENATVQARTALSVASEDEMVWTEPQCHAALGILQAFRGDFESAEHQIAAGLSRAAALDNLEGVAAAIVAAGALARARGDAGEVVVQLEGLVASPPMLAVLQFWPWFVDALIETGQIERSEREIERLEAAALVRGLDLHWQIVVLRARWAAAAGRPDDAVPMYAEALAHLGADDPFLDRALAHQSYGRLLAARGDRRGGVEQLELAREMLAPVGAVPFVASIDDDLSAAGHASTSRPARERSALELTDRERDVATLVAQGMTNPEVAAELYVSRKAVEYHLHNIFGKLGIRSRRELRGSEVLA